MLNRVHTARIFHIHEIDDVELTARRRLALRLVDAVMVVELLGEGRELVIVNHHRKALGRVLTDERLDNRKGLTRSRRTHHERTTEGVVDIDPSMTELAVIVVAHGDVHAVLGIDALLVLLETLVLEVEAVFHQSLLQVLRYVVERHMDAHRANDGGHHIKPDAQREYPQAVVQPVGVVEPHGQQDQHESDDDGPEHHLTGIELNLFLIACANAGDDDQQERGNLTIGEVTGLVNQPASHAFMQVGQHSCERVEQLRIAGILEKLNDQRDVDDDSEYAVNALYLFRFFHFYLTDLALFHHWRRQRVMMSCLVAGFM